MPERRPVEVYELPPPHGFNILHEPRPDDDSPCVAEEGYPHTCKNLRHLFPLAKPRGNA
jgi:hypothetical protein